MPHWDEITQVYVGRESIRRHDGFSRFYKPLLSIERCGTEEEEGTEGKKDREREREAFESSVS